MKNGPYNYLLLIATFVSYFGIGIDLKTLYIAAEKSSRN